MKMRLSKDKSELPYKGCLTLEHIPPETFEYLLRNRSAIECWVITVSSETEKMVNALPNFG